MKRNYYLSLICIVICAGSFFGVYPCVMTFINDSNGKIVIRTHHDDVIIFIAKNGRRRFW